MSRADILTVCTLAAHLAVRGEGVMDKPPQAAVDALALQRLGRRTNRMFAFAKAEKDYYGTKLEAMVQEKGRIEAAGEAILKPYGLRCRVFGAERPPGFYILELPSNVDHGDGFKL